MTMSVGLAKIQNDPNASPLVRKALGALSTPGLLVHDTGLSIDDDGRIIVKLNPNGGITQDEDGLAVIPVAEKIGIDSYVDPRSEAYDRQWNARLTGPAPNYFESSLGIGTEDFTGISDVYTSLGLGVQTTKVNIKGNDTQLRLTYDARNFASYRVVDSGLHEIFSLGTNPGFHFLTGDEYEISPPAWPRNGGVRINGGAVVERVVQIIGNGSYPGGTGVIGLTSWYEQSFVVTDTWLNLDDELDHVSVCPMDPFFSTNFLGWSARISAANEVSVRVAYFDEMFPHSMRWRFLIHQLSP